MVFKGKIEGFSKLSREEKISLISSLTGDPESTQALFKNHQHTDPYLQQRYDSFSENTLSNFFLPYGIAPNFLINGRIYHVPMVSEESSVVAAAASAARYWADNGGFRAVIEGKEKKGQVHFTWTGDGLSLKKAFEAAKPGLLAGTDELTHGMRSRGGGITAFELIDLTSLLPDYYQLDLSFNTADAMGANFINSTLESIAANWKTNIDELSDSGELKGSLEIIMSILSNYTPESRVYVYAETPVENLRIFDRITGGKSFAEKYISALRIADVISDRAVTHNKGIFNGIDSVVIATGNDFRAVEACGHAYASRSGSYRSLSEAGLDNGIFRIGLRIPFAVGTTGGLTRLHPLAEKSLEILGHPDSDVLMMIIAAAGLANNFSAVKALVTSGIQDGHMKMHLSNILQEIGADPEEQLELARQFSGRKISRSEIKQALTVFRERKNGI